MSNNIESTCILSGYLYIHVDDVDKWHENKDARIYFPEFCFLRGDDLSEPGQDGLCQIYTFSWHGLYSEYAYRNFLSLVISDIKGEAYVLIKWDGGQIGALHIKDGKATEHEVTITLAEEGEPLESSL